MFCIYDNEKENDDEEITDYDDLMDYLDDDNE